MQLQLANSVALTRHSVAMIKAPPWCRFAFAISFLDYVRSGPSGKAVSGSPIERSTIPIFAPRDYPRDEIAPQESRSADGRSTPNFR
jgi:hypothetical protein